MEEVENRYVTLPSGYQVGTVTDRIAGCADISKILPYLYLGSFQMGAKIKEAMIVKGITHVLTVGDSMPATFPDLFSYRIYPIFDDPTSDIDSIFQETTNWIEESRKSFPLSKILVHCWAGISRSASVVIYYLMNKFRFSYFEAFEYVRRARPWIFPNEGFRTALFDCYRRSKSSFNEPKENKRKENYDQCLSILNQAWHRGVSSFSKMNQEDAAFVKSSYRTIFGLEHRYTYEISQDIDMWT